MRNRRSAFLGPLVVIVLFASTIGAGPVAFAQDDAPPTIVATPPASPAPTEAAWLALLPPNGLYQALITPEELRAKGVTLEDAVNNAGLVSWAFEDGTGWLNTDHGEPPCGVVYSVRDSIVSLSPDGSGGCSRRESFDLTWTLEGDELIVAFVSARLAGQDDAYLSTFGKAYFERSWTRVE